MPANTTAQPKVDGSAAGWYKDGKTPANTGNGTVHDATYSNAADIAKKLKLVLLKLVQIN